MTFVDGIRIRPVTAADSGKIADIYKDTVLSSAATFDEVPPSESEIMKRIKDLGSRFPWIVGTTTQGEVLGYCYAHPHLPRSAYRWAVNVSIYLDPSARGRGVGRALYEILFGTLRSRGFLHVYAGITLPNPASLKLHQSCGFREVATYEKVGFKFDQWHDVVWLGLKLGKKEGKPSEPVFGPAGLDYFSTDAGENLSV